MKKATTYKIVKRNAKEVLHQYFNGNLMVVLYKDGTREIYITQDSDVYMEPDFPCNMDIKITNWCDAGCNWCHEASTTAGKHADIHYLLECLKDLPAGVEIAIGGGHAMAHPDFDFYIESLHKQGLIPNLTINQFHFEKEKARLEDLIKKDYIKGVGYSYTDKPCEWNYEHLVTHVIIGLVHPSELTKITSTNSGKVLLLGYKDWRKGTIYKDNHKPEIDANIEAWQEALPDLIGKYHLSFDNLAIEQTGIQKMVSKDFYDLHYSGEEGTISMYVDAVNQKVATTSYDPNRYPLENVIESFRVMKNDRKKKRLLGYETEPYQIPVGGFPKGQIPTIVSDKRTIDELNKHNGKIFNRSLGKSIVPDFDGDSDPMDLHNFQ